MNLALVLPLLITATTFSQELTLETPPKTADAATAASSASEKLQTDRKVKKKLEENSITYGGFLIDLSRAEKKSHLVSLRQPMDAKNDYKNLFLVDRPERPRGFVLFALGF